MRLLSMFSLLTLFSLYHAFVPTLPTSSTSTAVSHRLPLSLYHHFVAIQSNEGLTEEIPAVTTVSHPSRTNVLSVAVLGFSILTAAPFVANGVSGGGLDYAGLDLSGQDFSNGNYKGKDFTQGETLGECDVATIKL